MKSNQRNKSLDEKSRIFLDVELPIISIKFREEPIDINRRRLRLIWELIKDKPDLTNNIARAKFIEDVFKYKCTKEDLDNLKTFKDINIKKVITMNDDNVKIIKRTRWRSNSNIHRNYIHRKG
jgi:hypothetical protein